MQLSRLMILLALAAMSAFVVAGDVVIEGNDAMQFNVKSFDVKAGEQVKLTLKHVGKLPKAAMGHNLVILKMGVDAMQFGLGVAGKGGNTANGYIPTDAAEVAKILAHTEMIGGGETTTIEFTAPTKPGAYPFVCTFPGHVAMMKGVMNVR